MLRALRASWKMKLGQKGWNQTRLALESGLPNATVSNALNSEKIKNLRESTIVAIERALTSKKSKTDGKNECQKK